MRSRNKTTSEEDERLKDPRILPARAAGRVTLLQDKVAYVEESLTQWGNEGVCVLRPPSISHLLFANKISSAA